MTEEKSDEDMSFDFGKIKKWFKRDKPTHTPAAHDHHISQESKDEELSIDTKALKRFFKKSWVLPVLLIFIAMFLAFYLRAQPATLPITDQWAASSIDNSLRGQYAQQINQQFPHLPQENKDVLINKEITKFKAQNKEQLAAQRDALSDSFKQRLKDDDGTTYLIAIDPYAWFSQVRNLIENGHIGDEIRDGEPWNTHALAPIGRPVGKNFHIYFEAALYKILNPLTGMSIMAAVFWAPVIIAMLSVIPAFFIGRRISGNVGGFFAAVIVATHPAFLTRTVGGFSDTDAWNIFFPLLIVWLFFEAFELKDRKWKWGLAGLAGFAAGLFSFTWAGWWYVFDFLLATIGLYLVYLAVMGYRKGFASVMPKIKETSLLLGVFIASSAIFVSLFQSFTFFIGATTGPLRFLSLKAVATTKIWPNVYTTVAELGGSTLKRVVAQMGGNFYYGIALLGLIFAFMKKEDDTGRYDIKYALLFLMWFVVISWTATTALRFSLVLVPPFAFGIGVFVSKVTKWVSSGLTKYLSVPRLIGQVVIIALLLLILVNPVKGGFNQATHELPSMNDAWYNSLTKIKENSQPNAIITSWWDFGHWFKAIADRPVTFDGGSQNRPQAHWAGKLLSEGDERLSVGILRMLDCGANNAFDELFPILDDHPKTVDVLYEILVEEKADAVDILSGYGLSAQEIAQVTKYTHCNPPEAFVIASQDMIGKATVWGHFGSWDFYRAAMYQRVNGLDSFEGVRVLQEEFNLSAGLADQYYTEINTQEADRWIAPWPAYLSGFNGCQVTDTITCQGNVQGNGFVMTIDPETFEPSLPASGGGIIRPDSFVRVIPGGDVEEKVYNGSTTGFSVLLVPNGDSYQSMVMSPQHANSLFTRMFFLNGHGLKCYEKFDEQTQVNGGKIFVYKVDWDCNQVNNNYEIREEVLASHILISTEGRNESDVLELVNELKANATASNFKELAAKFSEDPSAAVNNGSLGYFGRGAMVPPFEEVAFSLAVGDISEPIKTDFGYHLILVEDKRER